MNNELYTPVLFLTFNRPEQTQRVFDVIRKVKPQKLYVAIDGPREGRLDDIRNCENVKSIVKNVDWDCESHYLFHEENLGCSLSGVTAWNWLFSHEDRMIFIEDDGFSTVSAFYFVQDLLEKYKNDSRIAYVSPINYGSKYGKYSYFFSRHVGGTYFMGTWKRVHDLYDYDMDSYAQAKKEKVFNQSFNNVWERWLYSLMFKGYIQSKKNGCRYNTYDIQMTYLLYRYDMIGICSNISMVRNIGFFGGANHAHKDESNIEDPYAKVPLDECNHIVHPPYVAIDAKFEKEYYKKRILHGKSWISVYLKSLFMCYFGSFYKKHIKPIRRR